MSLGCGRRSGTSVNTWRGPLVAMEWQPVMFMGGCPMVSDACLISWVDMNDCIAEVGDGVAERMGDALPQLVRLLEREVAVRREMHFRVQAVAYPSCP